MLFNILVVEGIGTGLILNGEVYGGSRIGMGGFGHIPLGPPGPVHAAVLDVGRRSPLIQQRSPVAASNRNPKNPGEFGPRAHALAQSGNAMALRELTTTATYLGRGIED